MKKENKVFKAFRYLCLSFVVVTGLVAIIGTGGGGSGGGGGGGVNPPKLYGTTIGNDTLGESVLVQLSPETGALINTIGPVGYYVNGLEYDPVSDKLYGTTSTNDPNFPDGLIEINMSTGVATTIGQAGMLINNPTVNSTGEMFAWTESGDDLVTVDTATGVATVVGNSGIGTGGHGLAFDQDNDLYVVNWDGNIWSIDASTGVGTFTNTIGTIAHHGDFHPETGRYWGINNMPWDWVLDSSRTLIVVDVDAATIDATLPTADDLHAITFCYEGVSGKAPKLYGTTVGNVTLGESVLVQLSTETGALINTIGPVGYYVNGLEYDPVSDKLYGTTSTNDPNFPDGLIEINMSTGVATTIGQAGMLINNPTVNSTGEMFAWTESSDDLVTVDTATGVATVVGNFGVLTAEHGLAFGQDNNLYLVNWDGNIYSIDPSSGVGTFTNTIGARAHHGDFHPKTGRYWGIDETWSSVGNTTAPRNLLVVDVDAATIDATLPTADDMHAITFCYDRANLLTNGGFETGDFTGWTTDFLAGGATNGYLGVINTIIAPITGESLAGPSEGTYYAISDQNLPSTGVLLQDFTVPFGDSEVTLTFDMFVLDSSGVGPINLGVLDHTGAPNQHVRVDILTYAAGSFDTGGTVVQNLYLDVDGYTSVLPYIPYSFNLSADLTAGETYQLRFAFTVTEDVINMGIDNVIITSQ